jgi:hypothetical protein
MIEMAQPQLAFTLRLILEIEIGIRRPIARLQRGP